MNKIELRRHYRALRRSFAASLDVAARETLERALAGHVAPLLAGTAMVGSYAAMPPEIDPVWIEKSIGPHAFPRVTGPDMAFHVANWRDLKPGFQSIPEPAATARRVDPDLVLVPLIAATLAGVRLGQGRGYYDRALARLRQRAAANGRRVVAVGLAFECQIAPALPADAWDMPLDWIATPARLVDCGKNR